MKITKRKITASNLGEYVGRRQIQGSYECQYKVTPWRDEDDLDLNPFLSYREAKEAGDEFYPDGYDIEEYCPEDSEVTASSIGEYVGRRLMTTWTVDLLVYGAEESEFYDFEQSYTGSFNDCLNKAAEYFDIIEENNIDGYVTLQADNSDDYYEFYNYSDIEEQFPDEF